MDFSIIYNMFCLRSNFLINHFFALFCHIYFGCWRLFMTQINERALHWEMVWFIKIVSQYLSWLNFETDNKQILDRIESNILMVCGPHCEAPIKVITAFIWILLKTTTKEIMNGFLYFDNRLFQNHFNASHSNYLYLYNLDEIYLWCVWT